MTLLDLLRGGGMGLTTDYAGSPVDIVSMMMEPFGYTEKEPFLGSKWFAKKLGIKETGSGEETVGRLATGLLNPATAVKSAALLPALLMTTGKLNKAEIDKIIKTAIKEKGGTVPLDRSPPPKTGYAYAVTNSGKQTVFDPETMRAADVKRFLREQDMKSKDTLGLWLNPDDGKMYLDKSVVEPSRFRSINDANANKQLAVWDIKRSKGVDTPYGIAEELKKPTPSSIIRPRPTVKGEVVNPKIYENPQKIVHESSKLVVPESPLLREMFGVGRHDLDELQLQMMDPSKASSFVYQPTRTPEHVQKVTTKANAQRLQDVVGLTAENPAFSGMAGWYNTFPLLERAVKLLGPEDGMKFFREHHMFVSPMSANATVQKEIAKGTFAHLLAAQGRLPEFYNTRTLPKGMNQPAHSTAHSAGARNMEASGNTRFWKERDPSQKTTVYYDTKIGENHLFPVGDAHFVRGTGLPDVRPKVIDKETRARVPDDSSIGKTEAGPIGEWYNRDVAMPLGLTGAVAQPLQWGGMAKATGVKSAIGAPYLELLATNAAKSGNRQGMKPMEAFDNYILAAAGRKKVDPYQAYLGMLLAGTVLGDAVLGGEAEQ